MIIDFHTHLFPKKIAHKVIEGLSVSGQMKYFIDPEIDGIRTSMGEGRIDYSVDLPVATRPDQVTRLNDSVFRQQEEYEKAGIICFGGLHPAFEDYRREIRRLKEHGIKGVKFHPAFQETHINDIRYLRMIDALSEAGMITLLHCGMDPDYMEDNYAPVGELIQMLDQVAPQRMVFAHMGGWQCWKDVERDLLGADVWMDTAYTIGPVCPREGCEDVVGYRENLSQEDFVRMARKHGVHRILFATDSPWSSQKDYVSYLNRMPLTEEEKALILGENAARLLL